MKKQLENKVEEIDARDVSRFPVGTPGTGDHREEIVLRVGKYGPFLEQGERRASLPDEMPPDELTLQAAMDLLDKAAQGEDPLGIDPETQRAVFIKVGRFGPYVQLEGGDDDEKPKNAGLLKGMEVEEVTLEVALKLLSLPRTIGEHPEQKEAVVAHNGRYGPYVKCGAETRSLPAEMSPIDVTLAQALELLAQPKQRRGRGAPKEPIKSFEASPVTGEAIRLLDGRYGPYVTDGVTNASLPKGVDAEGLIFADAVQLLAERAAKGPPQKKKKAAKKTAASKKKTSDRKQGAKKKTAKKKTVKKKSTTKRSTAKKKATAE